ncbi:glutaredoxin domain-containing cysteine-rich 2 [Pelobates cultripes]|uniref:Glutaredoxin domain-containing cysteine-rich 2 n=1 Tax=Pelobates cultripes TaxID=61616 RepID=A0AAD1VYW6_PELCU|nr:glutaredoxin domain-containing cysteine-rich 2 [Pelobates cultripes]
MTPASRDDVIDVRPDAGRTHGQMKSDNRCSARIHIPGIIHKKQNWYEVNRTLSSMEELQRKLDQRYEERPRKVRFKISSAYSGRVLKQVFEDGHELELPEEEYPHSFLHDTFEASEHYYSEGEVHPRFYPTTRLTAQRISVFRDGTSYRLASDPLFSECHGFDKKTSNVIDFGKIIIYTNNLKIIRTPGRYKVTEVKRPLQCRVITSECTWGRQNSRSVAERSMETDAPCCARAKRHWVCARHTQWISKQVLKSLEGEIHQCLQCKGSGCAPCSLCHGSKFSMLANRFKESYRALRCPACDEKGLQPCQTCAH